MKKQNPHLHNPHLPGEPFFWTGSEDVGVLLIHGLTSTTAEIRPLANYLHREAGYTISAPLLPGHGETPAALNQTRWMDWAEHVGAAYHELATRCRNVIVGGESTGAVLSLYLALHQPEIAALLLYSPAIRLALAPQDSILLRVAARFMTALPKESIDCEAVWQGYPVNPLKAGVELVKLGQLVTKQLDKIDQPVLVMTGQYDTTIHPDAGRMIQHGVHSRDVVYHHLEQSNHVLILDKEFDWLAKTTLSFIQDALTNRPKKAER